MVMPFIGFYVHAYIGSSEEWDGHSVSDTKFAPPVQIPMLSSNIFTNSAVECGASRSCQAVHRPPEVYTWPTQGELVYDWLHCGVGPGIVHVAIAGFGDLSWLVQRVRPFVCLQAECACRLAWHFCHVTDPLHLLQVGPVQLQQLMFRWLHFAMSHWVHQLYRAGMPKPDAKRPGSYRTPHIYTYIIHHIPREIFSTCNSQRSPLISIDVQQVASSKWVAVVGTGFFMCSSQSHPRKQRWSWF